MLAKDKSAGTTVIKHHCDLPGDRAEGVSSELWGPRRREGSERGETALFGEKMLSLKIGL